MPRAFLLLGDNMLKSFNDYKKSITIGDTATTRVAELVQATLKNSKALTLLPKYTLSSKYTKVPFVKLPDNDDTAFKVGAIDIQKVLKTAKALVTDETLEDATPNLQTALDKILVAQARLKVEKYIADTMLMAGSPETGASAMSFNTIIATIKKFPEPLFSIDGQFVALMAPATYFSIMSSMTEVNKGMVDEGLLAIAPLEGMPADKLIVLHTQGVGMGFTINGVEKERAGDLRTSRLLVQLTAGFGADTDYIKQVTLTS